MARSRVLLDDEMFGWDIVPAWENSFGIRFAHDDFAQATTVGDIWEVVERHLIAGVGENPSGVSVACATQRTFYALRRALMAQGLPRAAIVPRSQLRTLFPWHQRAHRWQQLQRALGLQLPRLRIPVALFTGLWAIGAILSFWVAPNWGQCIAHGFGIAIVVTQMPWLRSTLPAATLGELTVDLVAANYRALAHPYVRNNLGEIREIVLAGLARCGAESAEIDPDELRDGTKLEW